jgi:hypothetical protein
MKLILASADRRAHDFLTDQGAYTHEHVPESYEDYGDAENGPDLQGGPAFDAYEGESHCIIIGPSGLIEHQAERDWDFEKYCREMQEESEAFGRANPLER